MPSNKFAEPLRLEPRFSRRFATALALLYGGALLCLALPLQLPPLLRLALVLTLFLSAYQSLRRHFLASPLPKYLTLHHDRMVLPDEREAAILPDSFVHPWLIVLNLKVEKQRLSLVLFPDSLPPDDFRRLRVRLLHPLTEPGKKAAKPGWWQRWRRWWRP